jgi:hypothetical protein
MLEQKTAEQRSESAQSALTSRAEVFGEQLKPALDQDKLRKAIAKEKKFRENAALHAEELDDKKRKYNSMQSYEVSAEEMEAYRLAKPNTADPMFKIAEDELLDYEDDDTAPKKSKKR